MKFLLIFELLMIFVLMYVLYQFYKEMMNYKKKIKVLRERIITKNNILKFISYRCEKLAESQNYNNPSIGFRKIKNIAENEILDTDSQSNT